MPGPSITLGPSERVCVKAAVRSVCEYRGWALLAINVRSNHVHVVLSGEESPERMMNAFKSWSTRALREAQLTSDIGKTWARHGSTRYLWDEHDLEEACLYVINGQDE